MRPAEPAEKKRSVSVAAGQRTWGRWNATQPRSSYRRPAFHPQRKL